jgi:hypothetical protein
MPLLASGELHPRLYRIAILGHHGDRDFMRIALLCDYLYD